MELVAAARAKVRLGSCADAFNKRRSHTYCFFVSACFLGKARLPQDHARARGAEAGLVRGRRIRRSSCAGTQERRGAASDGQWLWQ